MAFVLPHMKIQEQSFSSKPVVCGCEKKEAHPASDSSCAAQALIPERQTLSLEVQIFTHSITDEEA